MSLHISVADKMCLFKFCILVLLFASLSNGYNITEKFDNILVPDKFINRIKAYVTEIRNNISVECNFQLEQYLDALLNKKLWAWQMLDAGSKIPLVILSGNLVDLGNFDQCLKIEKDVSDPRTIFGKYCLAETPLHLSDNGKSKLVDLEFVTFNISELKTMNIDAFFSDMFATCLPNLCSASDIQKLYSGTGVDLKFTDDLCQSKLTQPNLTGGDIATVSFLSVIFCIMLVSTVYDTFLFYLEKEPAHSLLIAFSILSNGKKFIASNTSSREISCLHGLRVISMMWIILYHRYKIQMMLPNINFLDVIQWVNDEKHMFIMGGVVSVDTFFLLSGLLVSYGFMNAVANEFKFNIFMYYIHRYLRLTPLLAVTIVIYVTVLKHLGSGPIWSSTTSHLSYNCKQYWWSTLLYVQNYVNQNTMCVAHTWYLAVDVQLFLLSPLILIPYKIRPKIGIFVAVCVTFVSVLCSFLVAWFYELRGFIWADQNGDFEKYYYYATHTRAGPWLIGIILGFCIYEIKHNHKKIAMNKLMALVLWTASLTILCGCIFTGYNTFLKSYEYDRVANSFYVASLRHGWALGVSGVIFACVTGYGGPVNWFLSLPIFQVVSKLTYSMYLLHYGMLLIVTTQMRTSNVFSNLHTLYIFWGDFAFTFATALIFTLAFESPILVIEKVILGKGKGKEAQQTQPL